MGFNLLDFLYLSGACFIGAFIDAIAGGGGIITIPAYMMIGLPIHTALGSNKMSVLFSCAGSSLEYIKAKKYNKIVIKELLIPAFVGAILGVYSVILIEEGYLKYIVLGLLIFSTIYTVLNKNMGMLNEFEGLNKKNNFWGKVWSFIISFYAGFFGTGSGAFYVLSYIKIYKFDFITACGNAKIINFVSVLASLLMFIYYGHVYFLYSIPIGFIMFLGAKCGTLFAIKKGSKFIRPFFIIISTLTIIKMIIELF